jgi:hypothetical protein
MFRRVMLCGGVIALVAGLAVPAAGAPAGFDALVGAWVRREGGYVILIRAVGEGGELDAYYYNPNPLPFARARALRQGDTLRAVFELRAAGYDGSTYELRYDAASDQWLGSYYQAVAKQSFEVQFARVKTQSPRR